MEIVDLPLDQLREAIWNPNVMADGLREKVKESIKQHGVVENLVVRPLDDALDDAFEVISGNQRLKVYRELGLQTAPCVVLHLDDVRAKLLAQVLNRTKGEDDLGLKAVLLKDLLEALTEAEITALLPETASSLRSLASMGDESIGLALQRWEQSQVAKLRHLTFQLSETQLEVVEEVLGHLLPLAAKEEGNPNRRGNALFLLCSGFLEGERYTHSYTSKDTA